jgi:N-acetylneuraminate synthase
MLDAIAETRRPTVVSSGMSPLSEIDIAVGKLSQGDTPVAVLQCTSEYPCPPQKVGLNVIPQLRERYGLPVGLSDHSATIYAGLAATMLSIAVLEVHLTLSRQMFGPDVPASLTSEEFASLVQGIRFIETALSNPVDKDGLAEEMSDLRSLFMRSPVTVHPLEAGHRLRPEDLSLKKPGTGLPAESIVSLVGRTLAHAVPTNHQMSIGDLESEDA